MISPLAQIDPATKIGKDVRIDAFAVVDKNVVIGDGCHIMSGAVVLSHVILGKNCTVFPHATIGGIPQDLKYRGEDTTVEIGNNTTVREYVTINRGTIASGKTVIGENCLLMAYAHIAHDCVIGNHVIIANAVQLAGHVEIGDYAIIGGMTGVIQFIKVGAHTYISGSSGIAKDVPPYVKAGRIPLSYDGVNSIGLLRRGFSTERVNHIHEIYRIIYLRDMNISQAIECINREIPDSEDKKLIVDFINDSTKGILKLTAIKSNIREKVDNSPVPNVEK